MTFMYHLITWLYVFQVNASSNYVYSVNEFGRRYTINLDSNTCNCGRFQLDEIPFPQAIVVLKK